MRKVSYKESAPAAVVASRRRDDVLMAALREATRAELAERGYDGVTFEGVARRAKTSRPVLSRRYQSRAQMVADALPALHTSLSVQLPGTSLRDDMLALLGAIVDSFQHVGVDTYRNLMADADDELRHTMTAYVAAWADRTIYRALSDAGARGEIGPADIPDRAATSIIALVRNEVFFTDNAIDQDTLTEMLDTVYLPLITAAATRSSPPRT
jgi:AcrR family transcriptional regulator